MTAVQFYQPDRNLIGATGTINKGPWKGRRGTVVGRGFGELSILVNLPDIGGNTAIHYRIFDVDEPAADAPQAAFWIVWNPAQGDPSVRHKTLADATNEAERIAAKHPGQEVFVLQSVRRTAGEVRTMTIQLAAP